MTTTARIGISLLSGDDGITPVELARAVEERGFESLWLPEHSHIPTSRDTPWPGSLSGEPLPEVYSRLLDATVSLAMAAAVTTQLRLGTSVAGLRSIGLKTLSVGLFSAVVVGAVSVALITLFY